MTDKEKKKQIEENQEEQGPQTTASAESPPAGQEQSNEAETVTVPLKDYADQLEELDDLRKKVDEFSDGWQRERAEFANYRKRVDRDRQQESQNGKIEIIKKYLAIHDDFKRAQKTLPQEQIPQSWLEGLKLIEQKLQNLLDGEGISIIPAENAVFNPEFHEAISHEENQEFESGRIIEVVQQGYTIGDRVIRPALVRVAK